MASAAIPGVQLDIVNAAALAFGATQHVARALSESGMHQGALFATAEGLGSLVPLTDNQEKAVTTEIHEKRGKVGPLLAKAMSIGWGHRDAVVALTRSKSGVGFLFLVSHLTVGTEAFDAAKAVRELMVILFNCDPARLPGIDPLTALVKYCSPFVHGLPLRTIYSHVVVNGREEVQGAWDRNTPQP